MCVTVCTYVLKKETMWKMWNPQNAQGPAPPLINQHKMHHSKVTKSSDPLTLQFSPLFY